MIRLNQRDYGFDVAGPMDLAKITLTMTQSNPPALALSPSILHERLVDRHRPALSYDGGDWRAWQRKLRRRVKRRLGWSRFDHGAGRVPLRPRMLWRREHDLGVIEKISFTAEAGSDVVGYWCVPHQPTPPHATFICLQGHSTGMHNSIAVAAEDETTPIEVAGDRDFALGCMRRGMAALCIEQRGFGQRAERRQRISQPGHHVSCYEASMHALQLGRTMIAERVYDVDRAVDYLAWRGDVSMRRVGVMGNSGGGTTSLFAGAILRRIRLVMPSCYFCTFADSIMAVHHCVCNYVPNLLEDAEMHDVAGLIAPKPVVMVNGQTDDIFPIDASTRAFSQLKKVYRAAGAPGRCRHIVGPGGHRFYADLAWPAMLKMIESYRA